MQRDRQGRRTRAWDGVIRIAWLGVGVAVTLMVAAGPPEVPVGAPRLPRDNLMVYRGSDHQAVAVRSLDDWQKRRDEIIAGMQAVMGKLPGAEKRCPLDMQVDEEVDCGSHVRRLVTYASEPG